ncbi:MAG TPA: O-antigen ligase family protein [Solirubrobacteraceae bacterium]|nr:O-antigen ligase family protein [Solirubrobacteraceae bacterium]
MSSHAASAEPRALARRLSLPRVAAEPLATIAFAAVFAAIALEGGGGLQLGPLTKVEMAVDVVAGVLVAAAIVVGGYTRRMWGGLTLALMAALVVVTALSISWAVEPSEAWQEANRTLSYLATMAAGVALVRLFPRRWTALLGGIVLASVVVCGYALLTKVFPSALNSDEIYARLREPYGYWNAIGLTAALAGPACLWLGARRTGHAALSALAYPILGLLFVTLLLAYSRGALLALAIGCAVWFAIVPLRLRGAVVLATSALGGGMVSLWTFSQNSLSKDRIALSDRVSAGHELGIALVAMVLVLLVAGMAIGFASAQRAPSLGVRRQAGVAMLIALALVPIAFVGALALSERGFGGSVSKGWKDLTDPNASTPANAPDRLTAVGSVRARYWNEALKMFKAHKTLGVGAGGYATVRPRFRNDELDVRHAHGYVVQTAADLGLLGLGVSLALLAAWLAASGRTVGLWGAGRGAAWTAERVGMATLLAICVVFGVHSFVDWTWFVPGNAILALLCAGWLAGRGPTDEPILRRTTPRIAIRQPWRIGLAVAGAAVALVAAWTSWQPQRAVAKGSDALSAAEAGNFAQARAEIADARSINPLSVDLLFQQAAIERAGDNPEGARQALQEAVRKQPANPAPWLNLAEFELSQGRKPQALSAIGSALYLDPRSQTAIATYLEASREN